VVSPDALVTAGAERQRALAGEDDHTDAGVVLGQPEGIGELEEGLRPEGVPDLGPVDGDLGDPFGRLEPDVPVVLDRLPQGDRWDSTLRVIAHTVEYPIRGGAPRRSRRRPLTSLRLPPPAGVGRGRRGAARRPPHPGPGAGRPP